MAENKSQEIVQKPEGTIAPLPGVVLTRRDFLRIASVAGAQIVLWDLLAPFFDPAYPSLSKGLSRELFNFTLGLSKENIAKLHQKIEERFFIDIVNPDKLPFMRLKVYTPNKDKVEEKDVPTVSWGGPELVTLAMGLDNLPIRMYIPGKYYKEKTRFVLFGKMPDMNPDPNYGTGAFCGCSQEFGTIAVGQNTFGVLPPSTTVSYSRITHELAHKVVGSDRLDLGELGKLLSIADDGGLKTIFRKPSPEYTDAQLKALKPGYFGHIANLRYGAETFDEFVAEGAEAYRAGRENFLYTYTPFLGGERVSTFYSWLKEKIFFYGEYDSDGKLI